MREFKFSQLIATDKEIYDLVMASPRRMTVRVLLELLADRRIFCSPLSTREELATYLSSLPHDFNDIAGLLQKGEYNRNADRTAFVDFDVSLTPEEIRGAISAYQEKHGYNEKFGTPLSTAKKFRLHLEYDEIDYSRTRLIQRQKRQADIIFDIADEQTIVRYPATDKARQVLFALKDIISSNRDAQFNAVQITVSDLTSAEDRTSFFMNVIRNMSGYRLKTVTDVRVARWGSKDQDDETGDEASQETESARQEMLTVINSVSMRGSNITLTEEYNKLLENGFFLTSITWRAEQSAEPRDLVQFEISFENGIEGTNFRYAVRYAQRRESGEYAKSMVAVPEPRKPGLHKLIEEPARIELKKIRGRRAQAAVPLSGDTQ